MLQRLVEILNSGLGAGLAGAVVGGLVTWLLGLRGQRRHQRIERQGHTSAFLIALAASLTGMAAEFRNGRVPHRYGHAFEGALKGFEPFVRPHLGSKTSEELDRLSMLAQQAESLDAELYEGIVPLQELNEWADDAERAAGDLEALAITIHSAA
jgi:hypothetical protein